MSTSKAKTTRAAAEAALFGDLAQMRRAPTHPGEIFRDDYRLKADPPVSQAEAARRLGWSNNRMNEFELGKRPMTLENAIAIADLTGTSAEFWMTLQTRRDLWEALQEQRKAGSRDLQRIA